MFDWLFGKKAWAVKREMSVPHSVLKHQSMILRPLKDVEMYLQENKRKNLELAIKHLDGIIIRPGESFSIWKNVGRPSASKGYLEGLVLNQGTIDKGVGGGLCQLGNLLFWIFAHSPLAITERYRHGFDVFPDVNRKVPFGAGATLAYNYIDLQAMNRTSSTFRINLWLDEKCLHGELLSEKPMSQSYSLEERNHKMELQTWGGYSRHNQIYKIMRGEDGEHTEELLVENHALMMYNPFLESK
jgi:vancomycin resistance protein VanW